MGIIEGNKEIRPQGRYGVSGIHPSLKTAPKIEASKLPEAVGGMVASTFSLIKASQDTADSTAVTSGVNDAKIAYRDMVEKASSSDPDESMALFDEMDKAYMESLDGYKENVRDEIKEKIKLTRDDNKTRLGKNTATALSARDDTALVGLGNTLFGHASGVISDPESSTASAVSAASEYLAELEQTMLPEFMKRVVTPENLSGKWRTEEEALVAFNIYAAAQLSELAEIMMTRDESALDSSIAEIVYGDYVREYGKDPSALIDKFKKGQAERVSRDAGRRGRALNANLDYASRPIPGDNWGASIPEMDAALTDRMDQLNNDPYLDYNTMATGAIDYVRESAINNMPNFSGPEEAMQFIDAIETHELFVGIPGRGKSFDAIKKAVNEEYVDQTFDRKNKITASITKALADPNVTVTEGMLIRWIDDATEGTPVGVRIVNGRFEEMTPRQEVGYYLEDALNLASTHTTGAADGAEFNAIYSLIEKMEYTSDSIETSLTTENSRIGRGITDAGYLHKVLTGTDDMLIVDGPSLSRSLKAATTPEEQTAMMDGLVAAGPAVVNVVPVIKEHYERVLDENPVAAIGLITKWSDSNPLSVMAMFGDRYDDRADGTWDLSRIILEGAIDNTPQNQRLAQVLADDLGKAGQIVDHNSFTQKFLTGRLSQDDLDELNPDGFVHQMFANPEIIKKKIAEGMSIPYLAKQSMSDEDAAIAAISVALSIQKQGLSTDEEIKAYLNGTELVKDLKELDALNGVVIISALENKDIDIRVPNRAVNREIGGVPIYNQAQKNAIRAIDTQVLATALDNTGGGTEAHMGFSNAFAISNQEAGGYDFLDGNLDYLVVPIVNVKESGVTADMGYAVYGLTEDGNLLQLAGKGFENSMVIRHTERHELGSEEDVAQRNILMNLRLASQHHSLGRPSKIRPKPVTDAENAMMLLQLMRQTN